MRALRITIGTVSPSGTVTGPNRLVRDALTPAEATRVLGGRSVSAARTVDGVPVLIEARPLASGGVVLVQRRTDALAFRDTAVRRLLVALAIAVALAALLGLLVAWRLARPLRRTAAAAHALADGRRDVVLTAGGPAEVAEVADAVNRLAGNLRDSEARQREFLLSVSHDLRTPLTAIRGYAESLADGVVPPEETSRVGAVVLAESQRLARLVGDLLDLARLEAQDFRIDLADVDVTRLAADAAAVWDARCAELRCPLRTRHAAVPARRAHGRDAAAAGAGRAAGERAAGDAGGRADRARGAARAGRGRRSRCATAARG